MNKSIRIDSLDKSQNTFTTFKGYQVDIYDHTWVLDINNKVDISNLSKFSEEVRSDVLNTFINFAKYSSSTHAAEMIRYALKYPDLTGESEFTLKGILEYKKYFNDKKYEYKLAKFRVFLKKLYNLGYSSVDDEVYDLMDSWRLSGNEKGAAVLSLDPDEGPFSPFEFQAIITRTNEYLAENKISYYEAALIRVFCATGRRPGQISGLKVKDLYVSDKYNFNDTNAVHILNIPRAKIRGASGFRFAFNEVGIRESIAQILFEHIRILEQTLSNAIKRELLKHEVDELPLFYDLEKLTNLDWSNKKEISQILPTEIIHLPIIKLTQILRDAVQKLGVRSRETGKPIHITAYRFRYTLGTNAARQKAGVNVIAKLLDHHDTQNAHCYVQSVPEIAQQISSIMDESLRKYADAFQGKVVKDEIEAQSQVKEANRISCVEQDCDVGSCGTHQYCNDYAPIACYLCSKFMPWANAPHHLVLEQLIKERDDLITMGCSLEVAAVNDRTIIAVQQVIDACKEFNHG
ncbi:site-specific integrase [Acinetobacter indicus]|uniref:site-specific integrase n=1 Tax=Acinetobacter TaxID=469 RepID=UPI0015D40B73|nr:MULTISPECIES: site-specific integrase [Acinetobacter]MCP0915262.1 site-specific integrase [Acinetobacter indicus]MCP0918387.1 site-specific integrase [Acinetobacter indicus]MCP0921053.1 site-specific integrase [Acinetobacter indicus]MDM1263456.1 site-specific integrase [Acinetobacter indicus]QSQ97290.1 site-specific integrase [Acinetobacter indicus]